MFLFPSWSSLVWRNIFNITNYNHDNWFTFLTEQLAAIPEFASLGTLFKSSKPVELTESETEYMVRCIKHTFAEHIVFQVRKH